MSTSPQKKAREGTTMLRLKETNIGSCHRAPIDANLERRTPRGGIRKMKGQLAADGKSGMYVHAMPSERGWWFLSAGGQSIHCSMVRHGRSCWLPICFAVYCTARTALSFFRYYHGPSYRWSNLLCVLQVHVSVSKHKILFWTTTMWISANISWVCLCLSWLRFS
jgi:hypothetical protein